MITPPKGHEYTPRGTPLHVAQLMMQLLRYTLENWGDDPDYPFHYTDDINTTGVVLDTVFNRESNVLKTKPVVIVSRGPQRFQQVAIGDTAHSAMNRNFKNKTALVTSSVDILVVSRESGEVDLLASEMFNFLGSARTVLPALTSIHQIQDISLAPVAPMEEDDRLYQAQASMGYTMQYKWTWELESIPLAEIGFYVNSSKNMDLPSI